MKKTVLSLLLAATAFSSHADMLLGADVEMNLWQQDYQFNGIDNGDEMTYTVEASLEHPIPLVPNVKLAQSSADADNFEYTKQDFTLYYEILDNDLVSIDVGAGLTRLFDAKVNTQTFDGYLPHVYGAAELGIPATPLFLFAKGWAFSYDDYDMSDLSAGIQYEIGMGLFDIELQAGYRVQKFDLDDFDHINLDSEAKGVFAGVNLDF
ncbi:TIGR04219 family outer membrane beta-barrel protein [Vibrio sp. AK197]|uniref:TIGR04219 family outer membrane beta-barrel protein n=1 Tax=Vibrio olivae TaxID=1243002 RepID=A0ABV5HPE4_9VIBR